MQFKQYTFVRNELLDQRLIGLQQVRAQMCSPHGQAFFCPICTEIWASVIIEGEATSVVTVPCDRHQIGDRLGTWSMGFVDSWQVPGSLLLTYDEVWNQRIRGSALAREFLLAAALRDKSVG